MRALLIVAVLALALAPAFAGAAEEAYRYIVADGVSALPGFFECGLEIKGHETAVNVPGFHTTVEGQPVGVDGQRVVLTPEGDLKPSHGGACLVPNTPGSTTHLRLVDDLDPSAAFGFTAYFGNLTGQSTDASTTCGPSYRGVQTMTFVAPDCGIMNVIPDAVSVSGTVYVERS